MPYISPEQVACLVGLGIGAVIDFRTGRLPNWLTFSMMALGAGMWAIQGAPLFALAGIAAAFAIHFPLFALNVVRAGDAKLVMGAAAFIGWREAVDLTAWYAVLYIPIGLGMLAVKGRLGNLVRVAQKLAVDPSPPDEAEQKTLTHLRTGPVIAAAGVLATFTDVLNIA